MLDERMDEIDEMVGGLDVDGAASKSGDNANYAYFLDKEEIPYTVENIEGLRVWCNPPWDKAGLFLLATLHAYERNPDTAVGAAIPERKDKWWWKLTKKFQLVHRYPAGTRLFDMPGKWERSWRRELRPCPEPVCIFYLGPPLPPRVVSAVTALAAAPREKFLIDSGATHHMTPCGDLLVDMREPGPDDPSAVHVASRDAQPLAVAGVGTMWVTTTVDGKKTKFPFRDVLYIPDLADTLISETAMTERGATRWASGDTTEIFVDGEVVFRGRKVDRMWEIENIELDVRGSVGARDFGQALATTATDSNDVARWHRRMGHVGYYGLAEATDMVNGMDVPKAKFIEEAKKAKVCGDCMVGGQTRMPRPPNPSTGEVERGGRVHMDVCGPMAVEGMGGEKYFVTMTDEATRMSRVELLRTKGAATDEVIKGLKLFEDTDGVKIKKLRSDRGGEFVANRLTDFMAKRGIESDLTASYSPQSNGLAERLNRTLMTRVRSMLSWAKLPDSFWGEALMAANRARNRLPARGLSMTPIEAFYGEKPDLSTDRTFGSLVYVHVPDDLRAKLDSRTEKGVMLHTYGNSGKMARVWVDGKIREVRDWICDEDTPAWPELYKDINLPPEELDRNYVIATTGRDWGPPVGLAEDPTDVNPGQPAVDNTDPPADDPDNDDDHGGVDYHLDPFDSDEECAWRGNPYAGGDAQGAAAQPGAAAGDAVRDSEEEDREDEGPLTSGGTAAGDGVQAARTAGSDLPDSDGVQPAGAAGGSGDDGDSTGDAGAAGDVGDGGAGGGRRYPQRDRTQRVDEYADRFIGRGAAAQGFFVKEPKGYREAVNSTEADRWRDAMQEEIGALLDNGTWELVPTPAGTKVIPNSWVYKLKKLPDGSIERFKARLVVKGFHQREGVDFNEIYAPVSKYATLRALLACVAGQDWELHQLDVRTAFLQGELEEEVYVQQPPGYEERGGKVCRLRRALYGLKQAPRAWHQRLKKELESNGFIESAADPGLFIGGKALLLVYVDDLLIAAPDAATVDAVKKTLLAAFDARDLGSAEYFLGMRIERRRAARTLKLTQERLATELVEKYGLADGKKKTTPMSVALKLRAGIGEPLDRGSYDYASLVGSLLYLSVCTRPDIAFAVGVLSKFMANPTTAHWHAAKAVLRYVAGSIGTGITYGGGGTGGDAHGYCDADYAGDMDTRRSTTAYVFLINGGAVSWASRRQATVAASTTEAEYMAAAAAAKEALWLRTLLRELGAPHKVINIYADNQSAIKVINNPITSARSKHIDVAYHFVRERAARGEIAFTYIPTAEMVADALTKALPEPKHTFCCKGMGVQ